MTMPEKDYVTNPSADTNLRELHTVWLEKEAVRNAQEPTPEYRAACFDWALRAFRRQMEYDPNGSWTFGTASREGSLSWRGDTVTVAMGDYASRGPDVVLKRGAVARVDAIQSTGQSTMFD